MAGNSSRRKRRGRRVYSDELKAEAVQMVLDGHRAELVAENLGLSSVSLLYRWKAKLLRQSGAAAATQEQTATLDIVERNHLKFAKDLLDRLDRRFTADKPDIQAQDRHHA